MIKEQHKSMGLVEAQPENLFAHVVELESMFQHSLKRIKILEEQMITMQKQNDNTLQLSQYNRNQIVGLIVAHTNKQTRAD